MPPLCNKTYLLTTKFLYMRPNNKAGPMKTAENSLSPPFQHFTLNLCHQPQPFHVHPLCTRCSHIILWLPQDSRNGVLFRFIVLGQEHILCAIFPSFNSIFPALCPRFYRFYLSMHVKYVYFLSIAPLLQFRLPSFNGPLLLTVYISNCK